MGKIIEVKALLFAVKFDILAITETHFRNTTKDSSISIPGYKIARRDRSDGQKGGGSLIYYFEDLNAYECKDLSDKSPIEAWVYISFHSQKLLVGSIYRPPDYGNFFDEFRLLLENLWRKRSNIVLLGDFSVNFLPSSSNSGDLLLKRNFLQLLSKFSLKNVISVPTRISGNSSTLIDLIITSVSHKLLHHGACNLGISDHHLIYAAITLRRNYQKPAFRLIEDFKNVNITALKHEFATAPWNICDISDDIDGSVWAWEILYNYITNYHIPIRKVKIQSNRIHDLFIAEGGEQKIQTPRPSPKHSKRFCQMV